MKVICLDEVKSCCTLLDLNIADFFEYDGQLFQKRFNINGTVAMAMNFAKGQLVEIRQSAEVKNVLVEKIEYSKTNNKENNKQ